MAVGTPQIGPSSVLPDFSAPTSTIPSFAGRPSILELSTRELWKLARDIINLILGSIERRILRKPDVVSYLMAPSKRPAWIAIFTVTVASRGVILSGLTFLPVTAVTSLLGAR